MLDIEGSPSTVSVSMGKVPCIVDTNSTSELSGGKTLVRSVSGSDGVGSTSSPSEVDDGEFEIVIDSLDMIVSNTESPKSDDDSSRVTKIVSVASSISVDESGSSVESKLVAKELSLTPGGSKDKPPVSVEYETALGVSMIITTGRPLPSGRMVRVIVDVCVTSPASAIVVMTPFDSSSPTGSPVGIGVAIMTVPIFVPVGAMVNVRTSRRLK